MIKRTSDMQIEKPRFDWSFNLGQLMTTIAVIGSAVAYIQSDSRSQAQIEMRSLEQEAKVRAYIPIVDSLRDRSLIQNNMIENISQAVQNDRASNAENLKAIRVDLSDINKSVANLREGFVRLETTVKSSVKVN